MTGKVALTSDLDEIRRLNEVGTSNGSIGDQTCSSSVLPYIGKSTMSGTKKRVTHFHTPRYLLSLVMTGLVSKATDREFIHTSVLPITESGPGFEGAKRQKSSMELTASVA